MHWGSVVELRGWMDAGKGFIDNWHAINIKLDLGQFGSVYELNNPVARNQTQKQMELKGI